LRAVQEDEPQTQSVSMPRHLPPNSRLVVLRDGRVVREIKRDDDGQPIGPVELEPDEDIAVVTITIGHTQGQLKRWQLRTHFVAVHAVALAAIVYVAARLLPWPWWLTVAGAVTVLGVLLGRAFWRYHRSTKAMEGSKAQ
jgi:hypothetical protein